MQLRHLFNVRRLIGALGLAAVGTTASAAWAAGNAGNVTVSQFDLTTSTNIATVWISASMSNPACQVGTAFVFDHTTARGKSLLTLLTSAQLSGKKVSIWGTGTCTTQTGLTWENISIIQLTNN